MPQSRSYLAASLLAAMIFFSLLSTSNVWYQHSVYLTSGVCAFLAGFLLFGRLRTSAKIQVSVMFTIGATLMVLANRRGVPFNSVEAISRNTLLLSMIMSVGFLKRLLDLDTTDALLPRGRRAFLHTLMSLGIFGSVINISAPIMLCDRIARERPVDFFMAGASTRVFCACSCWSPYFAGAALVLTLVEGVRLVEVMLTGFPLLVMTILIVYWLSIRKHKEIVDQFPGYPMTVSKLWLPVTLTMVVVLSQLVYPAMPILVSIALSAILISALRLVLKLGAKDGSRSLLKHILEAFPNSANELLLFLSAGVLATGLTAFVDASGIQLNLSTYSYPTACMTLAAMIVISALGIHPIIQISALTPLLLSIEPDIELLASTYLFAWALGTTASPLSGTHLIFQGRYGISAWKGAVQNWPFVSGMYFVAIALMAMQVLLTEKLTF